jgi:hypothetical protein
MGTVGVEYSQQNLKETEIKVLINLIGNILPLKRIGKEDSLDLIPSPSPSVKIQISGRKVYLK